MKINKHHFKKKYVAMIAVLLAITVLTGVILLARYGQTKDTSPEAAPTSSRIDYTAPTDAQRQAGNDAKKDTIEKSRSTNSSKTPDSKSSTQSSGADGLTTQITAATTQEGVLYIRNEINGNYQSGTCTLILSKDGKTVQKTSDVQSLPQSSTCKGFNIPVSELTRGTWHINLQVTVASGSAVATKDIEIVK